MVRVSWKREIEAPDSSIIPTREYGCYNCHMVPYCAPGLPPSGTSTDSRWTIPWPGDPAVYMCEVLTLCYTYLYTTAM